MRRSWCLQRAPIWESHTRYEYAHVDERERSVSCVPAGVGWKEAALLGRSSSGVLSQAPLVTDNPDAQSTGASFVLGAFIPPPALASEQQWINSEPPEEGCVIPRWGVAGWRQRPPGPVDFYLQGPRSIRIVLDNQVPLLGNLRKPAANFSTRFPTLYCNLYYHN